MTRPRDLAPLLSAWWRKRFPLRPEKVNFSDEILVLADMLMAQIDPDGTKPLICPPMAAEGYVPQRSVKPTGSRGAASE